MREFNTSGGPIFPDRHYTFNEKPKQIWEPKGIKTWVWRKKDRVIFTHFGASPGTKTGKRHLIFRTNFGPARRFRKKLGIY